MAARNVTPIRTGGSPSFPLANADGRPYNSRAEEEIIFNEGEKPKNYQFVGFRPGFPLQASELNEIQEHSQMQLTLTINMMNNWITSGAGPLWAGANESNPGDGDSEGANNLVYNTGIGVGGQGSQGGHTLQTAISGPGWRGATPLYPFDSPYSGSGSDKLVNAELLSNGNLKLTFGQGWWCVELPQKNPSTGDPSKEISGLKHWIWIESSLGGQTPDPAFQVQMPVMGGNPPDIDIPVGFVMQSMFYRCCTDTNDPTTPCDPDLGDNAAGFSNPVACGASRYAVNAIGASFPNTSNWPANSTWSNAGRDEYRKLSLVCKVNPFRKTVRYMNNILFYQW